MKKILVTGAGGYVGSVLVPKLLADNYAVKALDRFFFGKDNLLRHQNLEIITEDSRRLTPEIFNGIDAVIDLVAISNDPSAELFAVPTHQINCKSRINTATMAKEAGVKRYILPSSASIYGYHDAILDETSPTNPLTVYAQANEDAEKGVLKLADDNFCVTVIRQATLFGLSPRMRFDLAINGMTYGAYKTGKLPLMRDGKQYRPMMHVQDTTDLMMLLLDSEKNKINKEIFNAGCNNYNFQIENLSQIIASVVGSYLNKKIEIEWYGDTDHRSYRLDFSKIKNALNWKPKVSLESGVKEILDAIKNRSLDKTDKTITLEWYKLLEEWHKEIKSSGSSNNEDTKKWKNLISEVVKYNGILHIK